MSPIGVTRFRSGIAPPAGYARVLVSNAVALSQDEQDIVRVVREFVDRDVRPVARDLEQAREYPGKLIGQT